MSGASRASYVKTEPSRLAAAMSLPAGSIATPYTSDVWPVRWVSATPDATSHTMAKSSLPPLTRRRPVASNASERT